MQSAKVTFPNIVEGKGWRTPVVNNWGVIHVPITFLIDRDGKLVDMDMKDADIEGAVKELLEEKGE